MTHDEAVVLKQFILLFSWYTINPHKDYECIILFSKINTQVDISAYAL